MVVLRRAQAVGLGPHFSHLIYIYKSKITLSSALYTVTEKLLCIFKGPMKVISGLLPETWGYFCMKNCISTTRNCHSHIHESTRFILFALLKVHPRFSLVWLMGPLSSWAPGRLPGWPPPPPPPFSGLVYIVCLMLVYAQALDVQWIKCNMEKIVSLLYICILFNLGVLLGARGGMFNGTYL